MALAAPATATGFLSGPRGALYQKVTGFLSSATRPIIFPTAAVPTQLSNAAAVPSSSGPSWSSKMAFLAPRRLLTSSLALVSVPEFAAYSSKIGAGLGTNTALAVLGLAVKQRWLTSSGLLHAWVLGVALWSTLGWRGWAACVLYLVFGSLVTKVKQAEKEALGIAEKRGGARGPENVWGSAAAGTLCAVATLFLPDWVPLLRIGYVASLATKLSDTFASEIGKAYGKRTFLITTFKPVPPGTEGAVSLEGTLAGVVGSVLIAGAGVGLRLMAWNAVPLVLLAAFVATNVESLLGASLQNDQHPWATNEFINFLNTLIGSALSIAFAAALRLPVA